MEIQDKLIRKLVLLHTLILLFAVALAIFAAFKKKDQIISKFNNFVYKEKANSSLTETLSLIQHKEEIIEPLSISKVELKISPKNLRKIQVLNNDMIKIGTMRDHHKVWFPAKFFADNQTFDVKVRLRGDMSNHWCCAKKSWRIKFKGDQLYKGMRLVDMILPNDKGVTIEYAIHKVARMLGVVADPISYAHMKVNNVDMGLYFVFEKYSKEQLEKMEFPEGQIFRSNNAWLEYYERGFSGVPITSFNYEKPSIKRTDHYTSIYLERLRKFSMLYMQQPDYSFDSFRKMKLLMNIDSYAKFHALLAPFGNVHPYMINSIKWYYNNANGLLEPSVYDLSSALSLNQQNANFEGSFDTLLNRFMLSYYEFRELRNKYLWKIITDKEFDYKKIILSTHHSIFPYLLRGVRAGKIEDYDHKTEWGRTGKVIKQLEANYASIKSQLEFLRFYHGGTLEFNEKDQASLKIRIVPEGMSIAQIKGIKIKLKKDFKINTKNINIAFRTDRKKPHPTENGKAKFKISQKNDSLIISFPELKVWQPYKKGDFKFDPVVWTIDINFPKQNLLAWKTPGLIENIEIDAINTTNMKSIKNAWKFSAPIATNFDKNSWEQSLLNKNDFLKQSQLPFKSKGNTLELGPGEFVINKTTVIPHNLKLKIKPGTTIKIAPNQSLLTYKAISMIGTKQKPIKILPLHPNKAWGSFAVVNANNDFSQLDHVTVSGGSETHINGIFLSGQLCFYYSNVKIKNSTISNAKADDGLNIKKADFTIAQTLFIHNSSDAFDGDWVKGSISNTKFIANDGDGLDISGAEIMLTNSVFSKMKDKAISVGEKSNIVIKNTMLQNSTIGIAIKDKSRTNVFSSAFLNNKTSISLYQKKPIFGGGSGTIVSSIFWKNAKNFELDKKSKLKLKSVAFEQTPKINPKVSISDLRVGRIDTFYNITAENIRHKLSLNNSPFKKQPQLTKFEIDKFKLNDLFDKPIGPTQKVISSNGFSSTL